MIVDYLKTLGESHQELVEEIRTNQGLANNGNHGYNFIVAALKIIYPDITNIELNQFITDGPYDQQIDSVVIKDDYVDIYDFKGNLGYGENDIRLFVNSVRTLFFAEGIPDERNTRLSEQVNLARRAIEQEAMVRIRVVRMNPEEAPNNIQNILEELNYGSIEEYKIFSGRELVYQKLKIDATPINYAWHISIKYENQRENESQTIILRNNNTIESLYCRLSLKSLVDLYYSQEPNELIFESNVRSLQNDRKIKSEMLSSLSSGNKAKKFHKLHNGITIVCDSITNLSEIRFSIVNPQIVNGCQTITNLAKEFLNDRDSNKLKNGSVLCKIFHATDAEVERICLASNSQVSINPWDLRTNDPIQKQIESFLNLKGIKYSRKAKRRGSNDLTFVELGQWLYAAMHRNPMAAKNKRRTIFDATQNGTVYHSVFQDSLDLNNVLQVVNDGIFIRSHIKSIDTTFEKPADLHILAGFYMLRSKNWQQITKFNKIRARIRETIGHMHENHGDEIRYDTMFAKRSETWTDLEPRISNLL